MKTQTSDVQFSIRDYRAADFDRLWQIDQLCFPEGIAYTQMDLTGFVMKRNAITLVAEEDAGNSEETTKQADAPAESCVNRGLRGRASCSGEGWTRSDAGHCSRGAPLWAGLAADAGM